MAQTVTPGDAVQTPLGKGVVRDVKRGGHLVVDVNGRSVVLEPHAVTLLTAPSRRQTRSTTTFDVPAPKPASPNRDRHQAAAEIDLHGLVVDEAIARVERAINDALLADHAQLRVIHGRSGGRIRAAVHRWLRGVPAVRGFALDPKNPGVTVVRF